MSVGSQGMDCGPKCRSRQHIGQLITAVTKGSLRQTQLFISRCHNPVASADRWGRTVLHVAASCGKWELVAWLIEKKNADVSSKDKESGWTAIHRALFYGQLVSARILLNYGASLQTRDKEGLSPLDIIMKDRLPHVEYMKSGLNEVYTWGFNSNFTLGHENEQRKRTPEAVEVFKKHQVSIKQVVMCKYHTVFVSSAGGVYTCGHGQGGRLGQGNQTTCLEPKIVMAVKHEVCTMASASRDHTLLLMESGAVYSCGLNEWQQLGQVSAPSSTLVPKLVNCKNLRGKVFTGVIAQRFHSVLYNTEAVFTFGLNAGQLGHQKTMVEKLVSHPRQVSALIHKDQSIKQVVSSDACIAVATSKGDVYTLHQYQCRRIIAKRLDIEDIAVTGGHLDHKIEQDTLHEHGGSELIVAVRTNTGKIYLWYGGDAVLKRCAWVIRRQLFVSQMALNAYNLAFITSEGEAFTATLPKLNKSNDLSTIANKDRPMTSPQQHSFSQSVSDLVGRDEIREMSIERIPLIHRATGITTDPKGRNYAALQAQPNASLTEIPGVVESEMSKHFRLLLEEASTVDPIHDIIIQVGAEQIAAHKFILSSRSHHFFQMFVEKSSQYSSDQVIQIENMNPDIFRQLLLYMYTDSCDLLTVGKKVDLKLDQYKSIDSNLMAGGDRDQDDKTGANGKSLSAFEVYKKKNKGKKKGKENKAKDTGTENENCKNPVKLLQETAQRFGVKTLVKRLDAVKYINGSIEKVHNRQLVPPALRFSRKQSSSLHDVCIRAEEGNTIKCHKCVLVARVEYFRSMLASGWIEASNTSTLSLPISGQVLSIIIDYLYEDDSLFIQECTDAELLCNVLVIADQLLIERLKTLCEVAITSLITLKNACELLEFASMYNATQLIVTCQQYIITNLAVLLETRSVDVLSDDVIEDLAKYYKETVPGMDRRILTPYGGWPDIEYLERLERENEGKETDGISIGKREDHPLHKKSKSKKRSPRTKSIGDDNHDKSNEAQKRESLIIENDPIPARSASSETSNLMQIDSSDIKADISSQEILTASSPIDSPTTEIDFPFLQSPTQSGDNNKKSESHRSGSGRKFGRPSQRERKRLISVHSDDGLSETGGLPTPQTEASTKTWVKPSFSWGAIDKTVQSFKDLMLTEQNAQSTAAYTPDLIKQQSSSTPETVHGSKKVISFGIPIPNTKKSKSKSSQAEQNDSNLESPASPTTPGNPWQIRAAKMAASPPVESPITLMVASPSTQSFTEILKDELQQKETHDRTHNKPLSLIQKEEQAIQELLLHYRASDKVDEYITVERVPTKIASPTWAATQ